MFRNLQFPFIQYLEGSYFGDADVLIPGLKHFERDSTAVAQCEVNLFVLSRGIIVVLRQTFGREIAQMEELAQMRKRWHTKLINQLGEKAKFIQRKKVSNSIGTREFSEINLSTMHNDFEFESSDEEVPIKNATADLNSQRSATKIDKKSPSSASGLDEKRQALKKRNEDFSKKFQQTLTNFKFNMQTLQKQSIRLT